jgi:hypothetical protein
MNTEIIEQKKNTPGRRTKYNKKLVNEICSELAVGKTIRQVLSPAVKNRPCWESFRKWLNLYPELREQYIKAKSDGIEYSLCEAQELLNESLANSKLKDKTDLGQTHLVKAALDLAKWKAEKLNPSVYGKSNTLAVQNGDNKIVVKWES